MNRRFCTVLAALATITTISLSTANVHAGGGCGRGRIGISFGPGRVGIGIAPVRRPHPVYRPPVHTHVVQPQPVYSQPVYSQPTVPASPPPALGQQAPASAPANTSPAPVTQAANPQPPSTGSQPATQQLSGQTVSPTTKDSSEASALQLLAALAGQPESTSDASAKIPEFKAVAAPAADTHTGSWQVRLPGNQSVELILNDDGSFRWTATKDGKSSTFEGQYRLDDGRLTLVRSSDLQQMAGTWTGQGSKFTFKLDGATNSGLAFVRG